MLTMLSTRFFSWMAYFTQTLDFAISAISMTVLYVMASLAPMWSDSFTYWMVNLLTKMVSLQITGVKGCHPEKIYLCILLHVFRGVGPNDYDIIWGGV